MQCQVDTAQGANARELFAQPDLQKGVRASAMLDV